MNLIPICSQIISQYVATVNVLSDANKSDYLNDEKMQEFMNELLSIRIFIEDIGEALEICYDEPTKIKFMFKLPRHMRI